MSLLPEVIHPSWDDFFDSTMRHRIRDIENQIGRDEINPVSEKVFRFTEMNLHALRVVILGQDPYPERGVATGRAFEVGGLDSWSSPFRQISLKNILRLIYISRSGMRENEKVPSFKEVINQMENGKFSLLPPGELFVSWEKQGVLLLNTALTCVPQKPGSHSEIWKPFSDALISYISYKRQDLIWFLWGKQARSYKEKIGTGSFYESRHPMMCSDAYSDDFLKNPCFEKTFESINWTGK